MNVKGQRGQEGRKQNYQILLILMALPPNILQLLVWSIWVGREKITGWFLLPLVQVGPQSVCSLRFQGV